MRKEYNDRWNAPLVNPGFTLEEYEAKRRADALKAIDNVVKTLPKNRDAERNEYAQAE